MSIAAQAREVDKVKRSEHGIIIDPIFLHPDNLLADANELMGKYRISGVPITVDGKLVGIITNRDMRFEEDMSRRIGDIMTKENLITAPVGTSLAEAKEILRKHRIEKLPLVDKEGNLQGLITIKDIEKATKYPNSAKDGNGRLLVAAAVGVTHDMTDRLDALVAAKVDVVVIDTAHGHSLGVLNTLKEIKKMYRISRSSPATSLRVPLRKPSSNAASTPSKSASAWLHLHDPYRRRYRRTADHGRL